MSAPTIVRMTRREWTDAVCRRVYHVVAAATPGGLGSWGPAWKMVDEPSRRLLNALAEFERTGSHGDQMSSLESAAEVVAAWRAAAAEWERAGRPGLKSLEHA